MNGRRAAERPRPGAGAGRTWVPACPETVCRGLGCGGCDPDRPGPSNDHGEQHDSRSVYRKVEPCEQALGLVVQASPRALIGHISGVRLLFSTTDRVARCRKLGADAKQWCRISAEPRPVTELTPLHDASHGARGCALRCACSMSESPSTGKLSSSTMSGSCCRCRSHPSDSGRAL